MLCWSGLFQVADGWLSDWGWLGVVNDGQDGLHDGADDWIGCRDEAAAELTAALVVGPCV
jgi:hypothetical protein